MIGQQPLRRKRSHANHFGDGGLAAMDGKAHRRQCRRHEHYNQHQHAHEIAKEATHQWSSVSPAAGSGCSALRATALGAVGGGAAKSSDSRPCSATRIKSIERGNAAATPVSLLPRFFYSSKPTHTPQVSDGEKPMNQASVKSLVVRSEEHTSELQSRQ